MSLESKYRLTPNMPEWEKRRKYGCVMRALESYFAVKATDAEWATRLDRATGILRAMDEITALHEPKIVYSGQKKLVEQDKNDVISFIRDLRGTDTALGKKIQKAGLVHCQTDSSGVLRMAKRVSNLLILFTYDIDDPIYKTIGHMAHVTYIARAGLFSVSDGYTNFVPSRRIRYDVLWSTATERTTGFPRA